LQVTEHPERDNLYVEEIDIGEEKPRSIVSGLAKFIAKDDLLGKKVIVCANLKASKFAGVVSQGMVLAAANQEKSVVEVLEAPEDAKVGEEVTFDGFESNPDPTLNPKHKIFEKCAVDLKTNDELVATFKGVVFSTSGGPVTVKSLKNASIS
jgi:tRNA-binding EMAP/Myf-like protein